MRTMSLLGLAACLGLAQGACTKDGCVFSAIGCYGGGQCGQVDAAPRMPDDIWAYPDRVEAYVNATLKYWAYTGFACSQRLKQETCAVQKDTRKGDRHTGPYPNGPHGSQMINWATPAGSNLMRFTCDMLCDCKYPDCPDVPDKPTEGKFCSLCGPKFNAPIRIDYYFEAGYPYPPPDLNATGLGAK